MNTSKTDMPTSANAAGTRGYVKFSPARGKNGSSGRGKMAGVRKTPAILVAFLVLGLLAVGVFAVLHWQTSPEDAAPIIALDYRQAAAYGTCEDATNYGIDVPGLAFEVTNDCEDSPVTTTAVSQSQMDRFLDGLDNSGIREWEDSYVDPDILDGSMFTIQVTYQDGTAQLVKGQNQWPPEWALFLDALGELGIT